MGYPTHLLTLVQLKPLLLGDPKRNEKISGSKPSFRPETLIQNCLSLRNNFRHHSVASATSDNNALILKFPHRRGPVVLKGGLTC
jgi:hypothetical protein